MKDWRCVTEVCRRFSEIGKSAFFKRNSFSVNVLNWGRPVGRYPFSPQDDRLAKQSIHILILPDYSPSKWKPIKGTMNPILRELPAVRHFVLPLFNAEDVFEFGSTMEVRGVSVKFISREGSQEV